MDKQMECYVLDDLSLDNYNVRCGIIKEEFDPELGNLLYLKALDHFDEKYNKEFEEDIGFFWQILSEDDNRISW